MTNSIIAPPTPLVDPHTLSLMSSPTIFSQVLFFATTPTLATCLRVSQCVAHTAASILYRDISLIHILPPAVVPQSITPDTRSPFLSYIRTLRLPPHLLYDPTLCIPLIARMHRLRTVVVPADWPGWILCPNIHQPIFAPLIDAPLRPLKVIIKGLKSPAGLINNGLLQSDLLTQANEVVLCIDYLNPVYRGPRQRITAAMGGQRYSADLPECVKKLTVVLPEQQAVVGGSDRPAGFDMGADSGFFVARQGSAMAQHGLALVDYDSQPDVAPDLVRVLTNRKTDCKVVIVLEGLEGHGDGVGTASPEPGERSGEGRYRLKDLKERTQALCPQGAAVVPQSDEEEERSGKEVRWVMASEWEGWEGLKATLGNNGAHKAKL